MTAENKTAESGKPKSLTGLVVSTKMDKTAVVEVERLKKHPLYKKTMKRHKKYLAHDETNQCSEGDMVEIVPSRPLSKRKRWAIFRVIQKAQ
jgi:small subunit ribosomal protein S17